MIMKKVLKQVVGVDVAQKELVVCVGRMFDDLSYELVANSAFKNTDAGFIALINWVNKLTIKDIYLRFVMEATGVYHESFAYYLNDNHYELTIVLPNKISNFMRTLESRTITDKTCAQAIAQFGLEKKLAPWVRPNATYKVLQQLSRERDQLVDERIVVKNRLHAEKAEGKPNQSSIERLLARINFLNGQEKAIKDDIKLVLKTDEKLQKDIKNICTIPGVGELTAVVAIAETNGFELINSSKQLVSYAGLDVKEKQSGTSVKGKPKISKKGNKNLRKAMHMPSLSAVKYIQPHREMYIRLIGKSGIKMQALMAIQRKILVLIYTLYKNKTIFDGEYENKKRVQLKEAATL
jgi:transposase